MGKKRKGKKNKKNERRRPATAVPTPDLEQQGAAALAVADFRRARECYKALYARDPGKYRTPLIDSYQGILNRMLAKGMTSEAETVIARIRDIGGGEVRPDPGLMLQSLVTKGDWDGVSRLCIEYFSGKEAGDTARAQLLVDALVCCGGDIPDLEGPAEALLREVRVVRDALGALTLRHYDQVLDLVRPIGTGSLCFAWKVFLKALCAWYQTEDSKAQKLFDAIPPDSMLREAGCVWKILSGDRDTLAQRFRDADLLKSACAAAGLNGLRDILPRAEYLWRTNRHRDAVKTVYERRQDFPSYRGDFLHSLTMFFFNATLDMEEDRAYKYLDGIHSRFSFRRGNSLDLALECARAQCLVEERFFPHAEETETAWMEYLNCAKEFGDLPPVEEALIYEKIGDARVAKSAESDFKLPSFFGLEPQEPAFPREAEQYYNRCIAIRPDYREARLKLLAIYSKWGKTRERNRALEEIIQRFPDDAESLSHAGLLCMERKAYKKGMGYLSRALQLNPLDGHIRERFAIGSIRTARAFARESESARCRELLLRALEAASESFHDFTLGKAYLHARWAAFAHLYLCEDEAEEQFEQALRCVPDSLYVEYFCLLFWNLYGLGRNRIKQIEKCVNASLSSSPTDERAVQLISTWQYAREANAPELHSLLTREYRRIAAYAVKAAKPANDVSRLRIMLLFAENEPLDSRLRRACIKSLLKIDPLDPAARFFELVNTRMGSAALRAPVNLIEKLEPIRDRARREGLKDIAESAERMIEASRMTQRLKDRLPDILGAGGDSFPFEDDFDDIDGDMFDEDDGETDLDKELFPTVRSTGRTKQRPAKPDASQLDLFGDEE